MMERREPEKTEQLPDPSSFRFEKFADAASAQMAFDAAFPVGSPIERALKALSDMGAQGRTVNPTAVACRYVENHVVLTHRCWSLSLVCNTHKVIQRTSVALGVVGM
jgi:hypothetical protein